MKKPIWLYVAKQSPVPAASALPESSREESHGPLKHGGD